MEDKTLRPVSSDDATLRAEQQKAIEAITRQHDTEYLIKGLKLQGYKGNLGWDGRSSDLSGGK